MPRAVTSNPRRPNSYLALATYWLPVLFGLALLTNSAAPAGEWVYFKNGHKILADAVREEGDVVFLRIGAGNEIGYPKQLIERAKVSTETRASFDQKAHPKGGRGKSFDQLQGYQRAATELGRVRSSELISSHAMKSGQTLSFGFSYQDSTDVSRMQSAKPTRSVWDARAALGQSGAAGLEANQKYSQLGSGPPPDGAGEVGSSLRVVNKGIDQRRGNID